MSNRPNLPPVGTAGWMDLTVEDAPRIATFYQKVVGWKAQETSMGTYHDYSMVPPNGTEPVAGVCHAAGINQGLPSCWLVYFIVANLSDSLAQVKAQGGSVLRDMTTMGQMGRYAIIADPSGAACALFEYTVAQ